MSTDGGANSDGMSENTDQPEETLTDDARIVVYWDEETGDAGFELKTRSKSAGSTVMNTELVQFLLGLQDMLAANLPNNHILIYTRHKRGSTIFHGHPNYRGQGPWKDWALIDWAGYGSLPCHISCFVVLDCVPASKNGMKYGGVTLKNATYAVVESCLAEENVVGRSELFVPYRKETGDVNADGEVESRVFYLAETEAIVAPCAVIPDIGGPPNRYFLLRSREDWHKLFIQWVDAPHAADDMTEEEVGDDGGGA